MEYLGYAVDFVLHIDVHLDALVTMLGWWSYVALFGIIFLETGLVVTPFLPGDSLLFAAGALAARGSLNVFVLWAGFTAAAIIGDTVNYAIGRAAGEKLLTRFPRIVKPAHLEKTKRFFERYGGKTIVLARFVPIVRTLAPFLAGAGSMHYPKFIRYNIVGAFIWTTLFVPAGYFLANAPIIQENFSLILILIIVVSFLPGAVEYVRERRRPKGPLPPAA